MVVEYRRAGESRDDTRKSHGEKGGCGTSRVGVVSANRKNGVIRESNRGSPRLQMEKRAGDRYDGD